MKWTCNVEGVCPSTRKFHLWYHSRDFDCILYWGVYTKIFRANFILLSVCSIISWTSQGTKNKISRMLSKMAHCTENLRNVKQEISLRCSAFIWNIFTWCMFMKIQANWRIPVSLIDSVKVFACDAFCSHVQFIKRRATWKENNLFMPAIHDLAIKFPE
jgi:hypothetical protein